MIHRQARLDHLLQLSRFAEAKREALGLLREFPDHSPALVGLAWADYGLGNYAAAARAAQQAASLTPENAEAQRVRAEALLGLNRPYEATKAAQSAVRLAPLSHLGHCTLATCLSKRDHHGLAWQSATHAVELAPLDPHTHFVVGLVADTMGNPQLARRAYREALALDPQHAPAMHNLAVLDGRWSFARRARGLVGALRLDPQLDVARHNIDRLLQAVLLLVSVTAWPVLAATAIGVLNSAGWLGPALVSTVALALVVLWRRFPPAARLYAPLALRERCGRPLLFWVDLSVAGVVFGFCLIAWVLDISDDVAVLLFFASFFGFCIHANWAGREASK